MATMFTRHASRVTNMVLVGHQGMLAGAVRREAPEGWTVTGFDLPEFDLTDRDQVLQTLTDTGPDVIINCAAFTDVDGCEDREELATRVNGDGPGYLAEAARETGATLVHISTDYVFDGAKGTPYTEDDRPAPQSAYGRSKRAGEQAILASGLEQFFILRTSWLYGPGGRNFVETMVRLARERDELRVVADQVGNPTYTEDLARGIFNLLALPPVTHHDSAGQRHRTLRQQRPQGEPQEGASDASPVTVLPITSYESRPFYGLYHFANEGSCSWHGFAEAIISELRQRETVKVQAIRPITTEEYSLPARRPAYSVFSKEKYKTATGAAVPEWQDGLARYFGLRDA